jgi:hypothetical protein
MDIRRTDRHRMDLRVRSWICGSRSHAHPTADIRVASRGPATVGTEATVLPATVRTVLRVTEAGTARRADTRTEVGIQAEVGTPAVEVTREGGIPVAAAMEAVIAKGGLWLGRFRTADKLM